MHLVFSVGYVGHDPTEFAGMVQQLGAVVCDVRLRPFSSITGWSRPELQQRLGERYLHVPALGNVSLGTGTPMKLKNAAVGLKQVEQLLQTKPVILLCACVQPTKCHRTLVAEKLAKRTGCLVVGLRLPWHHTEQPTKQPQLALLVDPPKRRKKR
jgi:uncharacterized protein (DUF488 family)